jgi:hypothetical protein
MAKIKTTPATMKAAHARSVGLMIRKRTKARTSTPPRPAFLPSRNAYISTAGSAGSTAPLARLV